MMMSLYVDRILLLQYFMAIKQEYMVFETSEKIDVLFYRTNGQISLHTD